MLMRKLHCTKIISSVLALAIVSSVSSCSSNKREYETVKDTDSWYECSSFEVLDLFPSELYDYTFFTTIGATDSSIFVKSEAQKKYEGDILKITDEELINIYEQSILELSFDGKLIEKTELPVVVDDHFSVLDKAWISDGHLNTLMMNTDREGTYQTYTLNDETLQIPQKDRYYNNNTIYLYDFVSVGDYKVFVIVHEDYYTPDIIVEGPDGSSYEVEFSGLFKYGIDGVYELIPANNGKVILSVYEQRGDSVYVSLDPATGELTELTGLYGKEDSYMLEYCNGKSVAHTLKGINVIDPQTGELISVFDYCNVNAPMADIAESNSLYISDDYGEIILGRETYDYYGSLSGYKIMHLTKEATNPHAGKTILTLTTAEDAYPEPSDLNAILLFNEQNDSCFIKYVYPYDETGEKLDLNADIILNSDASVSAKDSSLYVDLMPYLDLKEGTYEDRYFSNAIKAAKSGEALYHLPLDISASGIVTSAGNVPEGQIGFTFEAYKKFVDEKCNGNDPMSVTSGYRQGKGDYFTKLFMNMSDLFIKDGKVDLSGEDFRELILFVEENGIDEPETDHVGMHNSAVQDVINEIDEHNESLYGKYGAVYGTFYSFSNYLDYYSQYGTELAVYGLPSFDGRGPMTISHEFVSISADTKYLDACVDYVKLLLSYEVQCTKENNPINIAALRYITEDSLKKYNEMLEMERKYGIINSGNEPISAEAVDKYIGILSSAYSGMSVENAIEDIVFEESSSYYQGGRALDDIIPVMQKRIQTVIDETS